MQRRKFSREFKLEAMRMVRERGVTISQAIACGRSSEGAATDAGVSAPLGVRYLTFSEREDITIEMAKGTGIRSIARRLGRSPSTISR